MRSLRFSVRWGHRGARLAGSRGLTRVTERAGACWGGGDPAVSPGQGAGPGGGRQGPAALGPCCGHTQAAPAAPSRGALPLRGSAGLGAQQVLQEPLELRVPEGLQAAGRPERGVPERPLRCGWGQPVSGHMPEAGLNMGSGRRPDSAPALTGTAGWRDRSRCHRNITGPRPRGGPQGDQKGPGSPAPVAVGGP